MTLLSYIAGRLVRELLRGPHEESSGKSLYAFLCTGNPGATGEANRGKPTPRPFEWSAPAEGSRQISNVAAVEYPEVTAVETFTFVAIFKNAVTFWGYAELAEPITVAVGDTVRFNVGSLVLEVP